MVGETAYLVGRIGGTAAEARLLREFEASAPAFEPVELADLGRIAGLIETYADLQLGTVDASVIATAERLGATTVATLDRRHFQQAPTGDATANRSGVANRARHAVTNQEKGPSDSLCE